MVATTLLLLFAVGMGVWSGKQEYDRQIREGDNYTNWVSIGVVGVANTLLCLIPGGKAVSAYKAATAGGSFVLKTFAVQFGKAVGLGIASGYATDAGIEVTRQLATGTKLTNLEYDRINEAGVTGAIAGGAGAIFGASVEALANTRIGKNVAEKATEVFGKGKTAVKNGFAKVTKKNGKTATETVERLSKSSSASIDSRAISNSVFNNGERVATTKQIRNYKKEMNSKGIFVVVDKKGKVLRGNKAAGFDYSTGSIYIKKKPGVIDLYHEGYHAEQYLSVGRENYISFGTLAREEYVYSRIMENSRLFNEVEIQGATDYIMSLRRRYQ